MIRKLWRSLMAQFNKLTNWVRRRDPVAEMQYEVDLATEQLKDGRRGLELYRGLVERVGRQVAENRTQAASMRLEIQNYLKAGDRETAGKFALQLERVQKQLAENEKQLGLHEQAYQNNLLKLQHASRKLGVVKDRIARYDAELRMSKTESEIARLGESLDFSVTTDLGELENILQGQIDNNRAAVRVAADLSAQGVEDVVREQAVESLRAAQALEEFERGQLTDGAAAKSLPALTLQDERASR